MAGEDFFKFNKGNEFRFSNFREIKEEDLKGADEKTKKLFNIFAGEDKILQEVEAKSLFNVLKSAAGDNQVLEDNEIKAFAKEHLGEEVDTNILATFVNNIFGTKEKPQTQAVQNVLANAPQKQQTFLEEAACKEIVIDIIDENLSEAYEILNSQYLGSISGWHDERKDKNDILKTSNVSKVLDYQNAGIEWMNKAKLAPPNGLTKKEYYEGNKQRIKDMILTRVLVLDTNTKFKELKNKYSEEKLAQIIGDYVEQLCSNASIEDLKDIQKQFVSYSGVEEIQALENVVDNAIKFNADKNKPMPYSEVPLPKFDNSKGIIPEYWNTDEPISFEEVYKIERGTEYSQYKIEQYALAKKEMEVVANAYNKKQQFVEFAEGLRKDETLNIDEKTQKVLEGFATFYALAEDGGLSQLKELIAESKLPISIDENGFNFGTLDDNAKNRALNSLLKLAQQSKEKEFEEFLNGKTIEDYQIALAQAHDEAIGDENGKMMAEAMKNDNLTCIQRWTGNTSMAGMGMTIVGGILCFTPLAPLGAGMITVGNTLAIGGMVAETGLGVADYATKDVQTAEEAEQLGKNFLMNAGGFIIGIGAGKAGMKAFSNLIDEKLVAVFGKQIASGNKMQALKTVFTNPEYLKNFMTAAGAKLSADFVISYAGDLAMMGILDTQDDWQSLLKANLTGILVGMSGDIKDVSGVGRPRNFGVSDGVRPMTEIDYGQRLLGNDVTVADPKTGATVEGTVTGLYSQNGQVEIEVNGQRYSTNDVAEVKGEAKVEVETPKVEIPLGQRLETASSREEFVAIRDEIKAMPAGTEKTALQQEYLRKWNEFSRKYNEQFDIRMEYKPESSESVTANVNAHSVLGIKPVVINDAHINNALDNLNITRDEIVQKLNQEGITDPIEIKRWVHIYEKMAVVLYEFKDNSEVFWGEEIPLDKLKENILSADLESTKFWEDFNLKYFSKENVLIIKNYLNSDNMNGICEALMCEELLSNLPEIKEIFGTCAADVMTNLSGDVDIKASLTLLKDMLERGLIDNKNINADIASAISDLKTKPNIEDIIKTKEIFSEEGINSNEKEFFTALIKNSLIPEESLKTNLKILESISPEKKLDFLCRITSENQNILPILNEKYPFLCNESKYVVENLLNLENSKELENLIKIIPIEKDKQADTNYKRTVVNFLGTLRNDNIDAIIKTYEAIKDCHPDYNKAEDFYYFFKNITRENYKDAIKLAKTGKFHPCNLGNVVSSLNLGSMKILDFILTKGYEEAEMINILNNTNEGNFEITIKLCDEISDLEPMAIANLITSISKENSEFALNLIKSKNYDFGGMNAILLSTKYKDYSIELAQKLCDENRNAIFIKDIISVTTPENIEIANSLYSKNNIDETGFLDNLEFCEIIKNTGYQNKDLANFLLSKKDFPLKEVAKILNSTSLDNQSFAFDLCNRSDFPIEEIAPILNSVKYAYERSIFDFAKSLCNRKDFPINEIADIIKATQEHNIDLAKSLCNRKDFPIDLIANILKKTSPENIKLCTELCDTKDFPVETIPDFIKSVNKETEEVIRDMCYKKDFPKNMIGYICQSLRCINNESNVELLQQALITPDLSPDGISRLLESSFIKDTGNDAGGNKGHIDATKVSKFISLLQNSKIAPYIVKLLNDGVDMDTASFLAKTKQSVYQNKQTNTSPYLPKNHNYTDSQIEFANTLGQLGMNRGEIDALIKFASVNGEIDPQILGFTVLLLKNGFPPNMILSEIKSLWADETPRKVETKTPAKNIAGTRSRESVTGLERKLIDQYNPEPEIWRSEIETRKWAEEKYQSKKALEYISTYKAIDDPEKGLKVSQQRKETLAQWYEFLETDETAKDNPFVKLIVIDAITRDLLPENTTLAPEFDKTIVKKILADAMNDSHNISFAKLYKNAIKAKNTAGNKGETIEVNGVKGTWFTVPQTDSSSPDFSFNVAKVKAYSDGTNWCIRSWNAGPYTQQGDMHFFVDEKGLTQICIRESNGAIAEIQKRQQNGELPIPYIEVIDSYITSHKLNADNVKRGIDVALSKKPNFDKLKQEIQELYTSKNYKAIFEEMGIQVTVLEDGTWKLSHYMADLEGFTLNDLGINENDLLSNVSQIAGNANFANSNATSIPRLRHVGGKFDFIGSKISDVRSLEEINGYKISWE